MKRAILSTQGTNALYSIEGLFESLLFAGVGVYLIYLSKQTYGESASTLETCAIILFLAAVVNFLYKIVFSMSYADVYEDRIVGKGIKILSVQPFDLSYEQITDLSYVGRNIKIYTAVGRYRIVTNAKIAKEVFEHYSEIKRNRKKQA